MYETLESEHLRLRKARETDWRSMMKHIWGDEAVWQWMLFPPARTDSEAMDRCRTCMRYQQERYAWFVALKDTDEAVGLCAMKETKSGHFEECSIGTGFQGKEYGKEIVSLLLDLAFEKPGAADFRFDCSFSETRGWDGSVRQVDTFVLTRDEYRRRKQK